MVARETAILGYLRGLGVTEPFEPRVERLLALAEVLRSEGLSRGMLGPNESERVLTRHVLESCGLFPFINSGGPTVDVGSGAGLPGLPLACIMDHKVILLDAQERRVAFLRSVINRLGLTHVTAQQARAEDAGRGPLREAARSVVARALAAPAVALELCLPLAGIGGSVALATSWHQLGSEEVRSSLARVATELGGGLPSYEDLPPPPTLEASPPADGHEPPLRIGLSAMDESRLVMVVPKLVATADRYPRRAGVPGRRPLG